jgi:flagellar hook-length control protein FliK
MPTLLSLLSVAFSPEAAKHQATASPATDTLSEMDFSAEFDALAQMVLPRPAPPVLTKTEPQPSISPIGPVEKSTDHVETQEPPEEGMVFVLAPAVEESAQTLMKAAPRQDAPVKPAFVKPDQPPPPMPVERPLVAVPTRSNGATMAPPSFPVIEPIQPDYPSAPALKIPLAAPAAPQGASFQPPSTMKVVPPEQDTVGRIDRSIPSSPPQNGDQSGLLSPPQKPQIAHPRTFIQTRPAQQLNEGTSANVKPAGQSAENTSQITALPDQASSDPKAKTAFSILSTGFAPRTQSSISGSAKAQVMAVNADKYATAPAVISAVTPPIPSPPVSAGTQVPMPAAGMTAQAIFNRQHGVPDASDKTRRADNKTVSPYTDSTVPPRPAPTGIPVVAPLTAVTNVTGPLQNPAQRSDRNHPQFAAELQSGLRADSVGLPPVATAVTRPELPMHVAQQIIDVVQTLPSRPVEISLNPEELGRLRLSLSSSEHGLVVHILAERPETMDLLRRHIGQLDQDLLDLGFDSVAFSFAEQNHPDSGENQQGDRALAPHSDQSVNPAGTPSIPTRASPSSPTGGLDLRL